MIKYFHVIQRRSISAALTGLALIGFTATSSAWGPDGHSSIGVLALNQLEPGARSALERIVSPARLNEEEMILACNWPDDVRNTEEWAWSAPRHYVNIPREDDYYLESRDCKEPVPNPAHPQHQCLTGAIKFYSGELANIENSNEKRWQAFAWLCHLVGDLHQPLHAGFADDRGGNDFEIVHEGEEMNLHGFWDSVLIKQNVGNWQNLVIHLEPLPSPETESEWLPVIVNDWTDESHQLAKRNAYPESKTITGEFASASWELVQQRIKLAATRLAFILNSELQEGN